MLLSLDPLSSLWALYKVCDKNISNEYSGMIEQREGRIVRDAVAIASDTVALKPIENIIMDKPAVSIR